MELITTTKDLATLCKALAHDTFVTVDTEFMRETTYWPDLCLIQIAGSELNGLIDPMAEGIDLKPFFELMTNEKVLKVFHAARQDIEIMVHLSGKVPHPVFDTQIAAMVCGFGDQVSYEAIVASWPRPKSTNHPASPIGRAARSQKSSSFTHCPM